MPKPNIFTPALSFRYSHSRRNATNYVVIHHSASKSGDAPTFHRWHLANGWNGIGYHFVITTDGRIEQGRPVWAIGAHASGHNSDSVGVCLVGDFRSDVPSAVQLAMLDKLLAWLCREQYHIGPEHIVPHNQWGGTSCPGPNMLALMDEVRDRVNGMPPTDDYTGPWTEPDGINKAREALMALGITDGSNPEGNLTRWQAWLMLNRVIDLLRPPA